MFQHFPICLESIVPKLWKEDAIEADEEYFFFIITGHSLAQNSYAIPSWLLWAEIE